MADMQRGWISSTVARWRAWSARRDERGAALVEAALILPTVIFLTFGAIEFGFAFNEQGTVRAASRSAARAASANPTVPAADFEAAAVDAATAVAANLVTGRPTTVWIYQATGSGAPPASCGTGRCAQYNWNGVAFVESGTGNWNPADRRACAGSSDRVGIYVSADHNYLTGFPAIAGEDDIELDAYTVMALEPDPLATGC